MNVKTFINTLKNNPNKAIQYELKDKFIIEPYIHMTEIKNVDIVSIDCGGNKNEWHETIMQLWTGVSKDDGHRLDSSKLDKIIEMIDAKSKLDIESDLIIEYGNDKFPVSQYSIDLKSTSSDTVYFSLKNVFSQCKGMTSESSCCSSSASNSCCA